MLRRKFALKSVEINSVFAAAILLTSLICSLRDRMLKNTDVIPDPHTALERVNSMQLLSPRLRWRRWCWWWPWWKRPWRGSLASTTPLQQVSSRDHTACDVINKAQDLRLTNRLLGSRVPRGRRCPCRPGRPRTSGCSAPWW